MLNELQLWGTQIPGGKYSEIESLKTRFRSEQEDSPAISKIKQFLLEVNESNCLRKVNSLLPFISQNLSPVVQEVVQQLKRWQNIQNVENLLKTLSPKKDAITQVADLHVNIIRTVR
ncbi:MAG: hypothetical protein LBE99_01185 [Puniceicoccales bacterium]|nr:hypothetical protein [Puniceicoccales bacterium]